jgi:multiple sugar transport system permease protein
MERTTPIVQVDRASSKGRSSDVSWAQNRVIARICGHALLAIAGVYFFLPFFWLVTTSLKTDSQVYVAPPIWIPHPLQWQNYPNALGYFPFVLQLRNTVIIATSTALLTVASSATVAYSFSRLRWIGRDLCFLAMLSTMMLPYQVTMIPLYVIYRTFGWVGTFLPLIVPHVFGVPYFIFLLRQFFLTLPRDLDDAAIIDGCSEAGVLARIILPLSKPALATVVLFQFLGGWNDFLGPLIYLTNPNTYTLSLGIQVFSSTTGTAWGWLMAVTTVLTVPVVVLFFFTQRTFIQGVALTGIKG